MNEKTVREAITEANKFIARAKDVLKLGDPVFYGTKETGALRRQSMELTRALSALRKVQ